MNIDKFFIYFIIILVSTSLLYGCGQANATIIKDGQIVILKKENKYALIVPIKQSKSQKGYYMRYRYSHIVSRLEDFEGIKIDKLPENTVYDNGKVVINKISTSWSFRSNGSGYLYYGEIFGNYYIPVEICVTNLTEDNSVKFVPNEYKFKAGQLQSNFRQRLK